MQETQETWVRSLGQKDPWKRKWQPMPVSLPGESIGRGAWWATVHMVTKNWTWLSTHTCNFWSTFCLYEFAYCTYFTCGIRQYLSLDIWFISVDIMFSRLQWVFLFSCLLLFFLYEGKCLVYYPLRNKSVQWCFLFLFLLGASFITWSKCLKILFVFSPSFGFGSCSFYRHLILSSIPPRSFPCSWDVCIYLPE